MAEHTYASFDDTMERPTQRPRLSFTSSGDPQEEVPNDWDLQTARAQNDNKLKSIFEGIFAKYSQDFTEIGDEIDLQTGEIVVDHGHLLGIQEETDPGDHGQTWQSEDEESEVGDEDHGAGKQDETEGLVFEDSDKDLDDSFEFERVHSRSPSVSTDSALAATSFNPEARPVSAQHDLKPPPENPGPVDPLWQVPEIPRPFATPTVENRHAQVAFSPRLPTLNIEPSPPGSHSLWSIPRRGRPRTEGKPRLTPSKTRPRPKRKYHSSPVAFEALDWSFAQAPASDDSDDPLQENQPSPTPFRKAIVRGRKRMRTSLFPKTSDDNRPELDRESPTAEAGPQHQSVPMAKTHHDRDASHSHVEQGDAQVTVAGGPVDVQSDSPAHSIATHDVAPASVPIPVPSPSPAPAAVSTPTQSRSRVTPDEIRLFVRLLHVQRKSWKEIHASLPHRKMQVLRNWNSVHWNNVRANPPRLTAPWTGDELEILDRVKEQSGISFKGIQAELPGRSRAEIEFELLRRWVGDEVWNSERRTTLL
ncbi:hypothetical protein N7532_010095 [Penicillium argentinense]|uniref:Myb-like domain-containing protein n=1 Tax=Penicillium argentinense TaxID=1131581 RepID=A0A9W9EP56_9EURO|nr:uncharacterized protein N7532_010095 [Penicillium argentinense]KAJ5085324.1 hypothetical protein N7532_010095 [Penicillium argentinense]